MLFAIPSIRSCALAAQLSPFHHSTAAESLTCELGFLFDMMLAVYKCRATNGAVPKVAAPTNLMRVLQAHPELAALGIFANDISISNRMQLFIRFLLMQLAKESELETRHASSAAGTFFAVQDTFGFRVSTRTLFSLSNTVDISAPQFNYATELQYSAASKSATLRQTQQTTNKLSYSFSAVLWSSLNKESSMRGWCAASDSYEPFKQRKLYHSLPEILTLLVSAEGKEERYWCNVDGSSHWLPLEVEVLVHGEEEGHRIIVSSLQQDLTCASGVCCCGPSQPSSPQKRRSSYADAKRWVVYDGNAETFTHSPASQLSQQKISDGAGVLCMHYYLFAVCSDVTDHSSVVHIRTSTSSLTNRCSHCAATDDSYWTLFNDFSVSSTSLSDVLTFDEWRTPTCIFYASTAAIPWLADKSYSLESSLQMTDKIAIPVSVLSLPSMTPAATVTPTFSAPPIMVAFDAEFVSVEVDETSIDKNGKRVMRDGRQVLARISIIDGTTSTSSQSLSPRDVNVDVLLDDYVIPLEPVVDYLTRFSGLNPEDLNPKTSRHSVVSSRAAYLKLRYYVDAGCIFVGHGLQKDFTTANIFVPPNQVVV